jgi:hypothetical protein
VPRLTLTIQDIDRHEDHTKANGREEQVDERDAVAEVHAQPVAAPESAGRELMRHAARTIVEFAECQTENDAVFAGVLQSDAAGAADERKVEQLGKVQGRRWGR